MPRRIRQGRSRPVAIMRATRTGTVTIAAAGTDSTVFSLEGGTRRLASVIMSAGWDAATIGFQVSADGTNFHELRYAGAAYTITAAGGAAADLAFAVDPNAMQGWTHIQLIASAAQAGGDRALTLLTVPA